MIRTDGIPTIAHPPSGFAARPDDLASLDIPVTSDDIVILNERETAGVRVELRWNRTINATALLVTDQNGTHGAFVPREKALDAFWHPYCYIPAP